MSLRRFADGEHRETHQAEYDHQDTGHDAERHAAQMLDCIAPFTQRMEQVHQNPIPARFDSQTLQESGNRLAPQHLPQGAFQCGHGRSPSMMSETVRSESSECVN